MSGSPPALLEALREARVVLDEIRDLVAARPTSLAEDENPILRLLALLQARLAELSTPTPSGAPLRSGSDLAIAVEGVRSSLDETRRLVRRGDRTRTRRRLRRALERLERLETASRQWAAEAPTSRLGSDPPTPAPCAGGCGVRLGPLEEWSGQAAAVQGAIFCLPCLLEGRGAFEDLGSYRLLGRIGGGGMGVVHLGLDPAAGRLVAIKFLHSRHWDDIGAQIRLGRELAIGLRLDHPNIVRFLGHGQLAGREYIVMEFAPGRTLRSVLGELGRLRPGRAAGIAFQIAAALEHARSRDVVHRDVKPENIRLDLEWRARLLDLGLAKSISTAGHSSITGPGVPIGTSSYSAPEQLADGCRVDHRADIFSLGVVLYEMVAGKRPFRGADEEEIDRRIQTGERPPLSARRPGIDPAFEAVVDRALAIDPALRYQEASEFARAIEPFLCQRS